MEKKTIIKICKECYKEFTTTHNYYKFCSKDCKRIYVNRRIYKRDKQRKMYGKARAEEVMEALLDDPKSILDTVEPLDKPLKEIRGTKSRYRKPDPSEKHLRQCKRCKELFNGHKTAKICPKCDKNNKRRFRYCVPCDKKFTFSELVEYGFSKCPCCGKDFEQYEV